MVFPVQFTLIWLLSLPFSPRTVSLYPLFLSSHRPPLFCSREGQFRRPATWGLYPFFFYCFPFLLFGFVSRFSVARYGAGQAWSDQVGSGQDRAGQDRTGLGLASPPLFSFFFFFLSPVSLRHYPRTVPSHRQGNEKGSDLKKNKNTPVEETEEISWAREP